MYGLLTSLTSCNSRLIYWCGSWYKRTETNRVDWHASYLKIRINKFHNSNDMRNYCLLRCFVNLNNFCRYCLHMWFNIACNFYPLFLYCRHQVLRKMRGKDKYPTSNSNRKQGKVSRNKKMTTVAPSQHATNRLGKLHILNYAGKVEIQERACLLNWYCCK